MTKQSMIIGSAYVAVMVALAGVAAWPIYASAWYVLAIAVSALVGAGIAVLSMLVKWNGWLITLILLSASFAVAVTLGVPEYWVGGTIVPDGLREAALGFVTGFKDLATSPLPVGTYRNLLVPAIAVFTVGTFVAVRFAFVSGRRAGFTVVAVGAMLAFGLLFGRTSVSSPLSLGPLTITSPVETGIGILGVLGGMWWLAWRARDERRQSIARAAAATGIRGARQSTGAYLRRAGLAAAMVVVAVGAGAIVTPIVTNTSTRDVIRSAVGPEIAIAQAQTPLAGYRTNFTNDNVSSVLFSYTSTGAVPSRIRLATLGAYDGESYRVDIGPTNLYERVPSTLEGVSGTTSTVRFEIGALRGIWLPTFGTLQSVEFQGAQGPELADGFYYNQTAGTGVVTRGVDEGNSYVVTAAEPKTIDLVEATSPGANPRVAPPESLIAWLDARDVPSTGAGLADAIETLRARGYLSHALLLPEGDTAEWMALLPDYAGFQSSPAGHSLARIDEMFTQLLEHESQVQGITNASLVAAIGDDEQFAVASALIAEQLGFPARVVVGVRTSSDSLPSCDGECLASDLAVWTEVQDASGIWIPIDVTPQYTEPIDVESRTQRDPENITDVRPDEVTEVAPPDPDQHESDDTPPNQEDTVDTTVVTSVMRWVGVGVLGLLVLLTPFLTILFAKVARRKERATAPDGAERMIGGWEEYVDAAVDAGLVSPTTHTRQELAEEYQTPAGVLLAAQADHAQFSNAVISENESNEFWEIVAAERRALTQDLGWWRRVRAALSLKSFVRQLGTPVRLARSRSVERGKRTTRRGRSTS
ncbi:transglutaminase domain-containing protein [Microbacterium sp. NC79]|uniref:transglutaminase domain-containing protein n=1 Tax=Microbacterium sp. NC79 TaxID=2851009 RepID=UPI001C2B9201|nr:transglutaminase domain-containing protein [Microbacterium sp. NC79]